MKQFSTKFYSKDSRRKSINQENKERKRKTEQRKYTLQKRQRSFTRKKKNKCLLCNYHNHIIDIERIIMLLIVLQQQLESIFFH